MRKYSQPFIWGAVWCVAMGITAVLCIQLAGTQPVMLAMVLLAACVESIGFVYAGRCWSASNYTAAAVSFAVGVLGLAVSVASEISYWSSTVDAMHRQAQRERSDAAAHDLVSERRRDRLKQLTTGKSPEQIEAEMRAALTLSYGQTTLGAVTRDCTNTASPAFRHCTGYLALAAQLASAKEARNLEGAVIASGTAVVETAVLRSFYDFPKVASGFAGGSVEAWSIGVVALIVAFIQSLLCGGLFIGFAPQRLQDAPTAPETERGAIIVPPAAAPDTQAEEIFRTEEELFRIGTGQEHPRAALEADDEPRDPPPSGSRPDPKTPRLGELGRREKPAALETAPAERVATVHRIRPEPQPVKADADTERQTVADWLASCCTQTKDETLQPSSGDCHASLLACCELYGRDPVDQTRLTAIMTEILKPQKVGTRYPRKAGGRIWPGLSVRMPEVERKRAIG